MKCLYSQAAQGGPKLRFIFILTTVSQSSFCRFFLIVCYFFLHKHIVFLLLDSQIQRDTRWKLQVKVFVAINIFLKNPNSKQPQMQRPSLSLPSLKLMTGSRLLSGWSPGVPGSSPSILWEGGCPLTFHPQSLKLRQHTPCPGWAVYTQSPESPPILSPL